MAVAGPDAEVMAEERRKAGGSEQGTSGGKLGQKSSLVQNLA